MNKTISKLLGQMNSAIFIIILAAGALSFLVMAGKGSAGIGLGVMGGSLVVGVILCGVIATLISMRESLEVIAKAQVK